MAGIGDELSFHKGTGQYYKTHRGRRYYFSADLDTAIQRYRLEWPYISADRPVPSEFSTRGPSVAQVLDQWLASKKADRDAGRIKPRTYSDYRRACLIQIDCLGRNLPVAQLGPHHFAQLRQHLDKLGLAKSIVNPHMTWMRMAWKWAYDSDLIEKPVKFGPDFKGPSKADIRSARHEHGRQTYTAAEIRTLLDACTDRKLRAAILLGINGGYTQSEVSALKLTDVKLDASLIDHLREKTKIPRCCPLWPETVKAIRDYLPTRQTPADDASELLFVSDKGTPMYVTRTLDKGRTVNLDNFQRSFARLLKKTGIKLNQAGFGKLRATFRTVADNALDANATRLIMGHELGENAEPAYIRDVERERLNHVVEVVRKWLFEA